MNIKMNVKNNPNIDVNEDFSQLFEEYVKNEKREGEVVQGVVVGIDKDMAIIDVGLKSEGRVPLSEFLTEGQTNEIKIGDTVDVYIERFEGRGGSTVLSREKALRDEAWRRFEELHNKDVNVDGVIMGRVKGGFAVELGGIIAFLPGSQVDIRPIKDISAIIGVSQPFKILKMDRTQGNVVVSRRAILEESRKEARDELLSNIKEGVVLEGVVKNITDYGAFIDLKSTDGLLHITDISWSKISHPSEVLTLGQTIKVMVIKYNPDSQRISLGLKQLASNPWEELKEKYRPGTKTRGVINTITDYGAFVILESNIEGLVYHTEIDWLAKNIHPRKLLKTGEEVEVLVLDIDIAKHRISLSIKQCKPNPWDQFVSENPVGTRISTIIRNISDFGMFASLEKDSESEFPITMLIPSGEISWKESPDIAIKQYKKGDIVECMVINVDLERERITASIKQLSRDSINDLADKLLSAESIMAKVLSVRNDGIEVELAEGTTAIINKNELSKHKDQQRVSNFVEGEKVEVKVLSFDKNKRIFNASIKALQNEQESKAMAQYSSNNKGSSLGDLLNSVLNKGE